MPDYGLLGGIGAGLSSFTDAFRSERAYQQQKSIQAQDQAIKKRMADIAGVNSTAELLKAGGSNAVDQYGLPPSTSGLMAPPGGGLMDSSPAPDQTAQQGASTQPGDKYIPSPREFALINQYREKGYNYDPRTGSVSKMSGPLGLAADVERQTKSTELKNKSMEQYDKFKTAWNSNEVKQNTDFADEAYGKVVNSYNNPSKFGDKALILNMVKLDMGKQAAREGTLEHMQENPQIMSKWGDYINQAVSGTLSPNTRDDLMKTATTLRQSSRQALEDQRQAVITEAKSNGIKPDFANDNAYKRMDKVASGFQRKIPGNPSAPEQGGLMSRVAGFLTPKGSTPAQAEDPAIAGYAKQHGLDYSVADKVLRGRGYGK